MTQAIASVLPVRLHDVALERSRRKPSESLTAYEHLLRARWQWNNSPDKTASAISELERAIELDPDFARAYAWLAEVYANSVFSFAQSADERAQKARGYAERALALDDQDAFVHAVAAMAYVACGDHGSGKRHAARALALNPNDFLAIFAQGHVLSYFGEHDEAVVWLDRAMRLDPHMPEAFLETIIECHYMRRAYDQAIEMLESWSDPPFYMMSILAACYAQLGDADKARLAQDAYVAGHPQDYDERVSVMAHLNMCRRQEDRDHWTDGYRKVGLTW